MIKTRRLALDVRYNSYPFAGQVGGDIESLTYTDSAARCGKLPVGQNVTGWVPASYCIASKEAKK